VQKKENNIKETLCICGKKEKERDDISCMASKIYCNQD
jgi:hypothetical protein